MVTTQASEYAGSVIIAPTTYLVWHTMIFVFYNDIARLFQLMDQEKRIILSLDTSTPAVFSSYRLELKPVRYSQGGQPIGSSNLTTIAASPQ